MLERQKVKEIHQAFIKMCEGFCEKHDLTYIGSRCSYGPNEIKFATKTVKTSSEKELQKVTQQMIETGLAPSGTMAWCYWSDFGSEDDGWYIVKILSTAPRVDKYIIEFVGWEGEKYRYPFSKVMLEKPKK